MKRLSILVLVLIACSVDLQSQTPEHLTLTLAWVADGGKSDIHEYVFITNGKTAYKTVAALKKYITLLPEGSTITWDPGCDRMGGEPLLSSEEDMAEFKEFCRSHGVELILIPSG